MWILAALVLILLFIWVLRPTGCQPSHCGFSQTPPIHKPSVHHAPFPRPVDTYTQDQRNFIS